MPQHNWPIEPIDLIRQFEIRYTHPDAGALVSWAVYAVECLHYLDDIDLAFDVSHTTFRGHRPDVVDVAHARWATGTCITALDLCAAGLGRALCGHNGKRELDLGDFDLNNKKPDIQKRRAQLPPVARQWLDDVLADPDYKSVKVARDWLTHSRVKRHFALVCNSTGATPQRLSLEWRSQKLPVRQLIKIACDLATWRVSGFLHILPQL